MTQEDVLIIYLAGATSIVDKNRKLRHRLEARLPCRILLPHDHVRCAKHEEQDNCWMVFATCKRLMDSADCVVVNLANCGRDTAAEIGYCYARGKPVIAFAKEGDYRSDPIVQGFLHCMVHDEDELVRALIELSDEAKSRVALSSWRLP